MSSAEPGWAAEVIGCGLGCVFLAIAVAVLALAAVLVKVWLL